MMRRSWTRRLFQRGASQPPAVTFPEAERRRLTERPMSPAIRKAIVEDNQARPEYARIRVQVLAIYRTATWQQGVKEFPPQTKANGRHLRGRTLRLSDARQNAKGICALACQRRASSNYLARTSICSSRTKRTSFGSCVNSPQF